MPIDYDPEDAVMCWPEGDYDAVLKTVEDKTSKMKPDGTGGNPMQVWTFEVYSNDGRTQLVTEYVVTPAATFKIKQLAKALGKDQEFKDRKFQADRYIGSCITAELTVEAQSGYDDKNRIGKFKMKVAPTNGQPARPSVTQEIKDRRQPVGADVLGNEPQFKEDDIPF